jgi:hypothetical protein
MFVYPKKLETLEKTKPSLELCMIYIDKRNIVPKKVTLKVPDFSTTNIFRPKAVFHQEE